MLSHESKVLPPIWQTAMSIQLRGVHIDQPGEARGWDLGFPLGWGLGDIPDLEGIPASLGCLKNKGVIVFA